MNKFCKDIIDFLESEYNDAYTFKLERYIALSPKFRPFNKDRYSLIIDMSPKYRKIIADDNIRYIYKLYQEAEYLEERKQYKWQKELIDMIEGS